MIQEALDTASHIVSDDRLGEPRTNRELFTLLEKAGWIDNGLAVRLREMAGFRNLLVHGYAAVDLTILEKAVEERLGDLMSFVAAIRQRLPAD
ncbi:MAG: type VII toxin-antitoxin system HepT family RNase toxin [Gemmatimonadota bacterium]